MSEVYFVTGATGAIGAALVPELLKIEDVLIKLLIRAGDSEHLQERFKTLLAFWELTYQDVSESVVPLRGDMTEPRFGLGQVGYAELSRQCTHIIHCAGSVRMNLPLEEARKSALGSAKNVVELALRCQEQGILKKVEFVSTVGVGGRMQGVIPERFITDKRDFHNTYEQAKAEAEDFIRPYVEQGLLPITVHRPSMVVGDSRTGKIIHFQVFYHICEFLSGRRTFGFIPNVKGVLVDIVPVDYVAEIIVWSSHKLELTGYVVHLCSGNKGSFELIQVMDVVRKVFQSQGKKLPKHKIIPIWLFQVILPILRLYVPARVRRAMFALPIFFEYLKDQKIFENKKIACVKKEVNKKPININGIEKILKYYLLTNG